MINLKLCPPWANKVTQMCHCCVYHLTTSLEMNPELLFTTGFPCEYSIIQCNNKSAFTLWCLAVKSNTNLVRLLYLFDEKESENSLDREKRINLYLPTVLISTFQTFTLHICKVSPAIQPMNSFPRFDCFTPPPC